MTILLLGLAFGLACLLAHLVTERRFKVTKGCFAGSALERVPSFA